MGDLATLPTFQPAPTGYTHTDLNGIFAALTIANGAVTTNKLADASVTLAKITALSANKLIGRDASGTGVPQAIDCTAWARTLLDDADAAAGLTTLGVSTFVQTILDDADAPAVLTTLGVSTFAKTLLDDADAAASRTTLEVGSMATRALTFSTSTPSGGADGDVHFQHAA